MTELPLTAPEAPSSAGSGEVLYRKWRPQSFAEVYGHEAITRTLRNSIALGRLAHAYLLCGPRGTGKTTLGRLLAKAANCAAPRDGEPCNECKSCLSFIQGRAMDFVEQDAASHNSVDDIRQLRENVVLTPMAGKRKIYLLDEVHMLTGAAQNALLKTLEEPPPHIVFVLATTEAHKVSGTIVSRCQRFDLKRIPLAAMVERLTHISSREGFEVERASLEEIARSATGSMRDAINALEQVVTYYGKTPTAEQVEEALGTSVDIRSGLLAKAAIGGDLPGGLRLIAQVRDDGTDMKQFAKQVVRYLRGLLLAKAGATESLELPTEMAAEVRAEAANISKEDVIRALQAFGRADFRDDAQSSLPLELALLDLTTGEALTPLVTARPEPVPTRTERPARPGPAGRPTPAPRAAAATSTPAEPPANGAAERSPSAAAEPVGVPPRAPASASDALLDQVRQACKGSDTQLSALLNGSCEVRSSDGDSLVLGFYHTFHLERIESGSFRQRLDALFSEALGRAVQVTYEHAPRERSGDLAPATGGHLVKAAQELGARAISSSKEPEGETDG